MFVKMKTCSRWSIDAWGWALIPKEFLGLRKRNALALRGIFWCDVLKAMPRIWKLLSSTTMKRPRMTSGSFGLGPSLVLPLQPCMATFW